MNEVGRWYKVARAFGEGVDIRFGHVDDLGGDPNWSIVSHEEVDGIGGFSRVLRTSGETVSQLPRTFYLNQASLVYQAKLLIRTMRGNQRLEWRKALEVRSEVDKLQPISWSLFDTDETEKICRCSRKNAVTVNSMLLHALDQTVRTHLIDPNAEVPWTIPVNIRTKQSAVADESNQTAMVQAKLGPKRSLCETHLDIAARLNRGEHWFWWRMIRLFARTPELCLRKVIGSKRLQTQFLFSNLGLWNPNQETEVISKGHWVFVPPVWFHESLSAGCVTYRGRLALSLHAHPSLIKAGHRIDQWREDWIDRIRSLCDANEVLGKSLPNR